MRPLLLAALLAAPVALVHAQPVTGEAPAALRTQDGRTIQTGVALSAEDAAAEAAVETALLEARATLGDSASAEVLAAIADAEQALAELDETVAQLSESRPLRRRQVGSVPVYPAMAPAPESASLPYQATLQGTVVAAGSHRLCREGRAPTSRWLHLRLEDDVDGIPGRDVIVAVMCDEWDSRHYIDRRVRITAWKHTADVEVRMPMNPAPSIDAPLYVTDPTQVAMAVRVRR